ncbi:MAG: hypothetical protein WAU71_17625, partial [Pyrinomonadaceae bacterium]
ILSPAFAGSVVVGVAITSGSASLHLGLQICRPFGAGWMVITPPETRNLQHGWQRSRTKPKVI